MTSEPASTLKRYAAFARSPNGGNPAGVWHGPRLPEPSEMQAIAARVGDSETIFLARDGGRRFITRYFSPQAEVSFCGHASIAGACFLAERFGPGAFVLQTGVGEIPLDVAQTNEGFEASFTSVDPAQRELDPELLDAVLDTLGWRRDQLSPEIAPALIYAGAWHLLLATQTASTLASLAYDFGRLKQLMLAHELTTLQLVHRESAGLFHARNPFPVGGVVEDPATGAAAAALGGYLRSTDELPPGSQFEIVQGVAMGQPSKLSVRVPAVGGIVVAGHALEIALPPSAGGRDV